MSIARLLITSTLLLMSCSRSTITAAEEPAATVDESAQEVEPGTETADLPDGLTPLNPQKTVLIDPKRKRVFLKSRVSLREGLLEMFACLAGTKEHESVVAIETDAYVIHAALLSIGAEPGAPVQFDPEYKPPTGQHIDVFVNWTDDRGRPYRVPAQYWMRHATRRYHIEPLAKFPTDAQLPEEGDMRYDDKRQQLIWFGIMSDDQRYEYMAVSRDEAYRKALQNIFDKSQVRPMEADFIFAGSGFWEDETGKKSYLAESGNLICVANFSDAIIDVDVQSDASNESLMFEPYTERIPPMDTEVLVELVPRFHEPNKSSDTER
ncbi:MAG: hypothetical protein KDA93_08640 [Planctomycetaceae bacterium]|nr:hypothetical protein [Planctomycetaceae bacterium]